MERILCPIDLTAESDAALRYAATLARAYEAELILMYCQPDPSTTTAIPTNPEGALDALLRKHATANEIDRWQWQTKIAKCDDPSDCITREASRFGTDLIIMRSRRRPHRAALLGSVAESVSRTAPCPVMVVHSDERDWVNGNGRKIALKRVLVAFDFSDHSEQALKLGLIISQEYQAELHLLHVLPPFTLNEPEISWYPLGSEGVYHKAARKLQKAVPDEAHLLCSIKNVVSEGQPYREIIHYAEQNEIDLVCIGAQGAGFGILALFGSNVDRVLRQAPCPVLVARPLRHTRRKTKEISDTKVVAKSNGSQPAVSAIRLAHN
ncbi:MAG TPA: universal stress protein [Pyrinomonadaceae bacterium]|jgi:nucleotide-binding universal stress UspA family protein|nr:universal stress protein [Pyrinomonadaceae bacterium]